MKQALQRFIKKQRKRAYPTNFEMAFIYLSISMLWWAQLW